jgi:hypothetical protein
MGRGTHKSPQTTTHGKRFKSTKKTLRRVSKNAEVIQKVKGS